MEITTILGIVLGFVCIIVSILLSGELATYVDFPSIFVVVGGVISATIAAFPVKTLKGVVPVMRNAFIRKEVNLNDDVEMIIGIANIARREGILALEDSIANQNDPYLKKGVMLIVDGSDPELVRGIMETELAFVRERHAQGQAVLDQMAAFSPAFGMVGTLIGLINMLKQLDDMAALGPNMSVALITTFYGVVMANLIFTPMSRKLKVMGNDEYLRKELILEGILSIQDGENPRIIREKLNAFLPYSALQAEPVKGETEEKGE